MSWVTIIMDPDDNKVKVDWFYLRKFILSTVRGDQFLYILLEVCYKYSSNCYNISFLILQSLSLRVFLLIYTISPFSSLPSTRTVDYLC